MVQWVLPELVQADLGDTRLNDRLVKLVEALAAQPEAGIPQACGKAGAKAAYRFFDNPRVTPAAILATHAQRTCARGAAEPVVLAVQDTSSWSLQSHPATQGLGSLNHSQQAQGLWIHTTLLLSGGGTPLGIVDQQVWARPLLAAGQARPPRHRPLAQKETQRWLDSLAAVEQALPAHPQVVVVGDREADIFELFAQPRRARVELLVRMRRTRRLVMHPAKYLETALAQSPVQGTLTIEAPRGDARPARQAQLELRWLSLEVPPPQNHPRRRELPAVRLQFIAATEPHPPAGEKAISWLLATTLAVESLDDAVQCLTWYTFRWWIERFHFVLKSGCHIEQLQLETAARLQRALACYAIVAWRLLWIMQTARQQPETPCTRILRRHEWQALHAATAPRQPLPTQPPTLRAAVRMIAQLGGFLGRKHDGEPGVKTLWRGYRRLQDLSDGWQLAQQPRPPNTAMLDVGNA